MRERPGLRRPVFRPGPRPPFPDPNAPKRWRFLRGRSRRRFGPSDNRRPDERKGAFEHMVLLRNRGYFSPGWALLSVTVKAARPSICIIRRIVLISPSACYQKFRIFRLRLFVQVFRLRKKRRVRRCQETKTSLHEES